MYGPRCHTRWNTCMIQISLWLQDLTFFKKFQQDRLADQAVQMDKNKWQKDLHQNDARVLKAD